MRRSSKYTALALLVSSFGPAALQAADGIVSHEASSSDDSPHLALAHPSRADERHARVVARRMKELLERSKRAV
jgi:hypothetical protein